MQVPFACCKRATECSFVIDYLLMLYIILHIPKACCCLFAWYKKSFFFQVKTSCDRCAARLVILAKIISFSIRASNYMRNVIIYTIYAQNIYIRTKKIRHMMDEVPSSSLSALSGSKADKKYHSPTPYKIYIFSLFGC